MTIELAAIAAGLLAIGWALGVLTGRWLFGVMFRQLHPDTLRLVIRDLELSRRGRK